MAEGMTNKELMLQMFEMQKETAVQMTELKNEMKHLNEKVCEHDVSLKALESLPVAVAEIKETVTEIKKKSDSKDSDLEARIVALENKAGKNALELWKKIGSGFLGAAITAIFAGIVVWIKGLGGK
ncbi:MAG: hypothetical protein MJ162_01185 [Treponema sp.]|nr:hypothetical protein [Treponema sp.]